MQDPYVVQVQVYLIYWAMIMVWYLKVLAIWQHWPETNVANKGKSIVEAYAADELPAEIAKYLRDGTNVEDSIFQSFLETDASFLSTGNDPSGSTATILVFEPHTQRIHIANTGDTRAVLCRQGMAINLSKDKKATDPEEIARISKEGGFVRCEQ